MLPIVVHKDVLRVLCYATSHSILMIEREEGVVGVSDNLDKSVAKQSLVKSHFVDKLSERFVEAIDRLYKSAQERNGAVIGEAFA